jgi:MFS transporter, PPP family, 3-phenylpropionic acid transporter
MRQAAMKRIISRKLIIVIAITSLAVMSMSLLQPMLPLYLTSIGISPTILGLMLSTGMAGMVLGESSGGWLADKAGIKVPMFIGTFLCAPLLVSFLFASDTALMFIVFFFWGIVRAAVFGPGRGYIGTNVSLSHKATFLAIYATAMAASRSLGTFTSGFISDAWGYNWIFIIATGIALLGGTLVIAGLRGNPWRKDYKAEMPLPADPTPRGKPLYRQKPFVIQSLIAALYFMAIGVIPFLSLLAAQVAALVATQIGILFTISAAGNAILLIPMGRLADRKNKRMMMTAGLLVTATSLVGISLSTSFAQLAASQVIGSIGGAMFGPAAVALLSENMPPHRQSTAMGIYGGCEDVGVIAGSALGGIVWSALGPTPTFLLIGTAPAVLGAIITFAVLKNPGSKNPGWQQSAHL